MAFFTKIIIRRVGWACLSATLLLTCNTVPDYCGSSEYNPDTQFCFDNEPYDKCGGAEYNPTNQRCEGGILKSRCNDNYFNPTTEFCSGVDGGVHAKCNGLEYDPTAQRCESGILKTKCGDNFYNQATDFCYGGNVYPKCGGQTYDPATTVCENNILKSECGTNFFNPASQFCYGDNVYSKCGGQTYNPDTSICENNIIKSKCGTGFFNPEIEFCHNNSIYELCNGKTYDPATTECKEISMVFVEGGTFQMGCTPEPSVVGLLGGCPSNELPVHSVTLGGFYIGRYEVTQKQWEDIMGSNPSRTKGYDLPVMDVSWNDVQEFIGKLNIETGKSYRLPTEAEWEFAARGGIRSGGYVYAGSNTLDDVAVTNVNAGIQAVGSKQPNELGIYDMSGNVSEWAHDGLRTYNNGSQINPVGPTTPPSSSSRVLRVYRGGGVGNGVGSWRISGRDSKDPDSSIGMGFRLALSL